MIPIKRFITYIMANVSKLHSLRYIRLLTQFYDTYCVSVCEQMDLMKYAPYSLRLYLIPCMISMTLLFSYTSKPLYQVFKTMFNTVFMHEAHKQQCLRIENIQQMTKQNQSKRQLVWERKNFAFFRKFLKELTTKKFSCIFLSNIDKQAYILIQTNHFGYSIQLFDLS